MNTLNTTSTKELMRQQNQLKNNPEQNQVIIEAIDQELLLRRDFPECRPLSDILEELQ